MTKPLLEPTRWATDLTNNTAPSSGQRDTGWTPNQLAVSDYFNVLAKAAYDWFAWMDSIFGASLNSTGISVVGYNAAGDTLVDTAVTRATNNTLISNLDINGTIKHSDWVKSGALTFDPGGIITVAGTPATGSNWNGGLSTAFSHIDMGTSGDAFLRLPVTFNSNERVKSVTLYYADNSNANISLAVYFGSAENLGGALNIQGTTGGGAASSITHQTVTLTSPGIPTYGLWVRSTAAGGSVGPKITSFSVTCDAVAY